jgi:hypothetical protein
MAKVNWHDEILGAKQRMALRQIAPILSKKGFYLAGGTALALYLGHRRSVDLDWFARLKKFDPESLTLELQEKGIKFRSASADEGTLYGSLGGVKLSAIRYNCSLLKPLIFCVPYGSRLASLEDIAAMKIQALIQRGIKRDFVDLYCLIQKKFTLKQIFGFYRRKYSMTDFGHVAYALTYFEDAEGQELPNMLWDVSWRNVKSSICALVKSELG